MGRPLPSKVEATHLGTPVLFCDNATLGALYFPPTPNMQVTTKLLF